MNQEVKDGRVPSEPGSRPTDQAPSGPAAPRVDPSRDRLAALREAQARSTAFLLDIIPNGHHCGPISATADQWDTLTAGSGAEDEALAALMPTEQDAIDLLHDCYTRLKKLGWNDVMYCPKDGSTFDAIEVGSTGIFPTHYSGEWPTGTWWSEDGGDFWPARPCLYRKTEAEKARWEASLRRFRALRDSDRSGEAIETRSGSTEGESARRDSGIAQASSPSPPSRRKSVNVEQGWQDIASAPKDGTEILVMFLGHRCIAKWANAWSDDPAGAEWLGVNVRWHDGRGSVQSLVDGLGRGGPTHWQPLPPPPDPNKGDLEKGG